MRGCTSHLTQPRSPPCAAAPGGLRQVRVGLNVRWPLVSRYIALVAAAILTGCSTDDTSDFVAFCQTDTSASWSYSQIPPDNHAEFLGLANPEPLHPNEHRELREAWLTQVDGSWMFCRVAGLGTISAGAERWIFRVTRDGVEVTSENKWVVGN